MSRVPQGTLLALKILYCWSQSSINLGQFIQKILELAELHDLNASDIVASEVQPCTLTFFISDGSSDRDRSLLQSSNLRCLNLGRWLMVPRSETKLFLLRFNFSTKIRCRYHRRLLLPLDYSYWDSVLSKNTNLIKMATSVPLNLNFPFSSN